MFSICRILPSDTVTLKQRFFLRLKGSDCSSELIGLYDVLMPAR